MAIVRLLLFLALATIAGALVLYYFKRDPSYLAFVKLVAKFTLIAVAAVLLYFAVDRMLTPSPGRPAGEVGDRPAVASTHP